jgi:hypothetical protein
MATQVKVGGQAPAATTPLTAEAAAAVLNIGAAAVRKRGRSGTLACRPGPDGILRYLVETSLVKDYHTANPPIATPETPRTPAPAAPVGAAALLPPPRPFDEAGQQRAIQVEVDRRMREFVDAVAAERRVITAQIETQVRQENARQMQQLTQEITQLKTRCAASDGMAMALQDRKRELTQSLANAQQLVDLLNNRWATPYWVRARLLELDPPLTRRQRINRWWAELWGG